MIAREANSEDAEQTASVLFVRLWTHSRNIILNNDESGLKLNEEPNGLISDI